MTKKWSLHFSKFAFFINVYLRIYHKAIFLSWCVAFTSTMPKIVYRVRIFINKTQRTDKFDVGASGNGFYLFCHNFQHTWNLFFAFALLHCTLSGWVLFHVAVCDPDSNTSACFLIRMFCLRMLYLRCKNVLLHQPQRSAHVINTRLFQGSFSVRDERTPCCLAAASLDY